MKHNNYKIKWLTFGFNKEKVGTVSKFVWNYKNLKKKIMNFQTFKNNILLKRAHQKHINVQYRELENTSNQTQHHGDLDLTMSVDNDNNNIEDENENFDNNLIIDNNQNSIINTDYFDHNDTTLLNNEECSNDINQQQNIINDSILNHIETSRQRDIISDTILDSYHKSRQQEKQRRKDFWTERSGKRTKQVSFDILQYKYGY